MDFFKINREVEEFLNFVDPSWLDETGKLLVDKVFSRPGTTMPWIKNQNFPTPDSLRHGFDKPEELLVVTSGNLTCVIRKSDLPHLKKREKIANEVLEQFGVVSFEQMCGLSWDQIRKMREEINRRMSNE